MSSLTADRSTWSLAKQVANMSAEAQDAFLGDLSNDEVNELMWSWEFNGRPKQLWPAGDWDTHAVIAGRGFGKTWTGAQHTRAVAEKGAVPFIHLIAPTPADYRDVMIEGPAGLQTISPPDTRPAWYPSKRLLEWPNGVKALCFCVTPDTEALTRDRGWVTHETLVVGDVIAVLGDAGELEWQQIDVMNRFDVVDEPMVDIKGRFHSSRTTDAHRWPLLGRRGDRQWATSVDILESGTGLNKARIVSSAPAVDVPTEPKWSDALVELVAWYTAGRNVFHWRLTNAASRAVTQHTEDDKVVSREFIMSLTRAQLELFVARCVDGGGHRRNSGFNFAQNNRARVESFSLALTLLGVPHSLRKIETIYRGEPYHVWEAATRRSSSVARHKSHAARSTFTGTVWCPTTKAGTWLARRGGNQFFTGNSAEDPEALRGPQCGFIWCVAADEPIETARGAVPICEVTADDLVWTRDGLRRVTRAWKTKNDAEVLRISTMDGRSVRVTPEHVVWTERGWVRADEVVIGDSMRAWNYTDLPHGSNGTTHAEPSIAIRPVPLVTSVISIENAGSTDVYDLTVEDAHEFFAGGLLVHNCDEPGAWTYGSATWDMAQFGLRMGKRPRQVMTTTPKPLKWLKAILADERTLVTRGTTYENADNLAPVFLRAIIKKYEGTRLGRQELLAELIEAVEGALWTPELVEVTRRVSMGDTRPRVMVGVDPAATSKKTSDETGIVVCATDEHDELYVLEDASPGRVSPHDWASAAISAYYRHRADAIVAEVNNGGEMVVATIRTVDANVPVDVVHATRGKAIRAEPIVSLFEQQGVSGPGKAHLLGVMPFLEEQMTGWVPNSNDVSPDRLDAMVWAATQLTQGSRSRLIV